VTEKGALGFFEGKTKNLWLCSTAVGSGTML